MPVFFKTFLFLFFCANLQAQKSNFDADTEDWQANDDAQNDQVYWAQNFGNPAPSIFAVDDNTGQPWYFLAPPCFLGSRAYMYGKSLKYDLFTNDMQPNVAYMNDVILFGANGLTLYHDHAYRPTESEWTSFEVAFIENQWHKNNSTGPLASQSELQSVLDNIQELHILGEFKTGPDRAWLDNVFFNELPTSNVSATICEGNTYQFGSFTYNATGIYTDVLQSISGCDSADVLLDLTVLPSINTQLNYFLCDGSSIVLPDGTMTTQAGVFPFFYTTNNGCDSTVTVEVILSNSYNGTEFKKICQGETLTFPDGQLIFTAGIYDFLGTTVQGCDSNLTITLAVLDTFFEQKTAIVCESSLFLMPDGTFASQSGSFIYRYKNSEGCDSTLQIDLTVLDSVLVNKNTTICANEVYVLPDGNLATESGLFAYNYTRINGCDSTFVLDLKILLVRDTSLEALVSQGIPYQLPDGTTIRDSNLVKDYVLKTTQGCDSIVHLKLRYVFYNVFIPNAFSPNEDGINDFFTIFADPDVKIIHQLNIYDRWGELIFINKNFAPNEASLGWNGQFRNRKSASGVYTYWAEIEFLDGKKRLYKGDFVLIN
jgi:gliding motility-associated-like protein